MRRNKSYKSNNSTKCGYRCSQESSENESSHSDSFNINPQAMSSLVTGPDYGDVRSPVNQVGDGKGCNYKNDKDSFPACYRDTSHHPEYNCLYLFCCSEVLSKGCDCIKEEHDGNTCKNNCFRSHSFTFCNWVNDHGCNKCTQKSVQNHTIRSKDSKASNNRQRCAHCRSWWNTERKWFSKRVS